MSSADKAATDPTNAEAFEARYAVDADPWDFAYSGYEQRRYRVVIDTLGSRRYRSAYEPACSIGVLTGLLAPHCDALRAIDISATAVAEARRRCRHHAGVTIEQTSVADDTVPVVDLAVFSEVGYYFDVPALDAILGRLERALVPGGDLVACHWTGTSDDHILDGDTVHARIRRRPGIMLVRHERHRGFVLGLWRKP